MIENFIRKNPEIHSRLSKENKINNFHSPMRGNAFQTSRKIKSPTQNSPGEILDAIRKNSWIQQNQWLQ